LTEAVETYRAVVDSRARSDPEPWEWPRAKQSKGYGTLGPFLAHRGAYGRCIWRP